MLWFPLLMQVQSNSTHLASGAELPSVSSSGFLLFLFALFLSFAWTKRQTNSGRQNDKMHTRSRGPMGPLTSSLLWVSIHQLSHCFHCLKIGGEIPKRREHPYIFVTAAFIDATMLTVFLTADFSNSATTCIAGLLPRLSSKLAL